MSTPLTGDRKFRNDVVRIADMTVNTPVIDGYEFSNCRILGPAIIVPQGNTEISNCTWDAPGLDAIFWEIPADRMYVVGAVAVLNCVFSNCKLEGVGLGGTTELRQLMERAFNPGP